MDNKSVIKEFNEYVDGFVECCTSDKLIHDLLKAVARLIEDQEERIAIMSEGGWHKATELPKKTGDYIVTIIEMERWQSVTIRCYSLSSGWGLSSNEKLVCWMPFPEPPKEGEA